MCATNVPACRGCMSGCRERGGKVCVRQTYQRAEAACQVVGRGEVKYVCDKRTSVQRLYVRL